MRKLEKGILKRIGSIPGVVIAAIKSEVAGCNLQLLVAWNEQSDFSKEKSLC